MQPKLLGILAFFNMQLLSSSVGIEDKKMVGSDIKLQSSRICIEFIGDMTSACSYKHLKVRNKYM